MNIGEVPLSQPDGEPDEGGQMRGVDGEQPGGVGPDGDRGEARWEPGQMGTRVGHFGKGGGSRWDWGTVGARSGQMGAATREQVVWVPIWYPIPYLVLHSFSGTPYSPSGAHLLFGTPSPYLVPHPRWGIPLNKQVTKVEFFIL